jgi:hypothetical protein
MSLPGARETGSVTSPSHALPARRAAAPGHLAQSPAPPPAQTQPQSGPGLAQETKTRPSRTRTTTTVGDILLRVIFQGGHRKRRSPRCRRGWYDRALRHTGHRWLHRARGVSSQPAKGSVSHRRRRAPLALCLRSGYGGGATLNLAAIWSERRDRSGRGGRRGA